MINCVLIGEFAGADLPDDSDGITIIGDGVKSLDHKQKNVLFLGDKCAIGTMLFGRPFNLKELICDCLEQIQAHDALSEAINAELTSRSTRGIGYQKPVKRKKL